MRSFQIPDRVITQQLNNKLANRGVRAPCHVNVLSKNGEVTLSGTVQFAHQKGAAVQVATGITGVRRVIDLLTLKPASRN